jgi:hypothetical protein
VKPKWTKGTAKGLPSQPPAVLIIQEGFGLHDRGSWGSSHLAVLHILPSPMDKQVPLEFALDDIADKPQNPSISMLTSHSFYVST